MHPNYNYGNHYSNSPSSSANWSRETEWSSPDTNGRGDDTWKSGNSPGDTWRGVQTNGESWAPRTSQPEQFWQHGNAFQYGRDRAPSTIDDQFLIGIGAKRLNNGNLIDRDGFTLRTRNPDCSAPLPPTFNPGKSNRQRKRENRDLYREERAAKKAAIEQKEKEEMEMKVRQQLELVRKMEEEEALRKKNEEEQPEREQEEDLNEYDEEEVPTPEETQKSPEIEQKTDGKRKLVRDDIAFEDIHFWHLKKNKETEKPKPSKIPREESWYNVYRKSVEERKQQVYGQPAHPIEAPSGFFFSNTPSTTSYQPPPSVSMNPFGIPMQYNGYHPPMHPPMMPPPPKVSLPPPTLLGAAPSTSSRDWNDAPRKRGILDRPYNGPVEAVKPIQPVITSGSSYNGPVGVRVAAEQPKPAPQDSDSDDDSDDDAIAKLREIFKSHGQC